jgi:putative inorganic carbon (hco3(-)) transporter
MLRSLFLTGLVVGALPLALLFPHIGVLLWTWMSIMNPHTLAFGFAATAGYLNFVAAVTIIGWLFSREPKWPPASIVLLPLALFTVWVLISTLLGPQYDISEPKFTRYFKMILIVFFTLMLINNEHRVQAFVYVVVISLSLFIVRSAYSIVGGAGGVSGPAGTMIADRNHLAVAMAMMVPLFRYLSIHDKSRAIRYIALMFIFLSVLGVLATSSRGGFITIGIVLTFFFFRSKNKLIGLSMIGVFAIGTLYLMPQAFRDRMTTIESYTEDASAVGRLQMWRFGLELAQSRPIMGGGFQAFHKPELAGGILPTNIPLRASHSIYFEVLGEHGYPGLLLFLWIFAAAMLSLQRTITHAKHVPELVWAADLSRMVQLCLVAFMVGGALLEIATLDIYYTLVALGMCTSAIVQKRLAVELTKHLPDGRGLSAAFGSGLTRSTRNTA